MADANGVSLRSPVTSQPATTPLQGGTAAQGSGGGTGPSTPPAGGASTSASAAPTGVVVAAGDEAATSLDDDGTATRPRDIRTMHMVLTSLGVNAYQERVPLQLLDFAYRYTNSVLGDAQHLYSEGHTGTGASGGRGKADKGDGDISLAALRLAISSRMHYQSTPGLPKETLLELASTTNKIKLPTVEKDVRFGIRLPHERFVLSGTGWNIPEEWDSEGPSEPDNDDEDMGDGDARSGDGDGGTHANGPEEDEDEEMGEDAGI